MRRTPHTTFRRGKRVIVKFRNHEYIIDKFVERTGKFIVLENHVFKPSDILSMGIYKPSKKVSSNKKIEVNDEVKRLRQVEFT